MNYLLVIYFNLITSLLHSYIYFTMSIWAEDPPIVIPDVAKDDSESKAADDTLHILFLVDRSGSMITIREAMLTAMNSVISEQKEFSEENPDKKAIFTLATFNHELKTIVDAVPMSEVKLLEAADYVTRGSTSLYEAIIQTLSKYKKHKNVIAVIVTDGEDTASQGQYTQDLSSHYIKRMTEIGWKFIYLSSDPSTVEQGVRMGLSSNPRDGERCNTNNVHADYRQLSGALQRSCSSAITRVRTTGDMDGMGASYNANADTNAADSDADTELDMAMASDDELDVDAIPFPSRTVHPVDPSPLAESENVIDTMAATMMSCIEADKTAGANKAGKAD